ncbi:M23 family metallopeptidase [Ruthenibacterium sp. CLA-JM-H11]|uniref:M23 family metallopeptidase n=1 Tax=Ruthenibacterium intestinale TaxID=3133163 RepID=A0ABV1GCU7_9FIRM
MRALKRTLLWLLLVAVLVGGLVGGTLFWLYRSTDETDFEPPALTLNGQTLTPTQCEWHAPVLNGVLYKTYAPAASPRQDLGEIGQATVPLSLPKDALVALTVTGPDGATLYSENSAQRTELSFSQNGTHILRATVEIKPRAGKGYGVFRYEAAFTVNAPPQVQFSSTRLEQGGVVCVRVSGVLDEGAALQLESDLPATPFVDVPGGKAAFLGLHYNREPGDYAVTVRCGDFVQSAVVTVVHRDYPRLYPPASEPASAVALQQWRDAIYPLYSMSATPPAWSGRFTAPLASAVESVPYGSFVYEGGSQSPSRSSGVEYSCAASSPVTAPAAGTVVFAGSLELTGNTVVLDHGAGLKTYFFYLSQLSCEKGQTLEQGAQLGLSGERLFFEARIGNQSIDPAALFDGSSGLYFAQ